MTEAARARTPAASHPPKWPNAKRPKPGAWAREDFFDSSSDELRCALDGEGRILRAEGGWRALIGVQPDEAPGSFLDDLVHPADRERLRRVLERPRSGGGCVRDLQVRLLRPGRDEHVLTVWTFMSGSGAERILGVGLRWPDTVRLERRNEELEKRLAELETRYADVELFAGMAAHQLAEPLIIAESSSIMLAEELGDGLDPQMRGRLEAIGHGAARARQLMDALLQDARTASHSITLSPVAIGPLVQNTLGDLRLRIDEMGATMTVGPLPTVMAEPRMLSVILTNIVSNALKYGPRGGEVRVVAERVPDGWRLTVGSDGNPIPVTEADRIFEPFRRGPGERRAQGNGLGLAICARLVQRLGGRIGVLPHRDGNDFYFVLPAVS
jgi:signal transduction histidine kinase